MSPSRVSRSRLQSVKHNTPFEAIARVDRRTKNLVQRVGPGEIAVIDHEDLDRTAAEGLVRAKVGAVVNASCFISGRYPNMGALLVASAGILMVDSCGSSVMSIPEGSVVRVAQGVVYLDGKPIAHGQVQELDTLEEQLSLAKRSIGDELEKFAENTLEYMNQERDLILEGVKMPSTRIRFEGRHVLIVVRGYDYLQDLQTLGSYARDFKPIIIGVDGGADALIECGHVPDIIIGDFDSVSDKALKYGAELIVHGYDDGRAPGADRLEQLGLGFVVFQAKGTSEDIAMLLAHELGAELIVAVGSHASLVEFLDKGRAGMASTFLTRLRVGPILVDAKGVNKLYEVRVRKGDLAMLVGAALVAMVVSILISQLFRLFLHGRWLEFTDFWDRLIG